MKPPNQRRLRVRILGAVLAPGLAWILAGCGVQQDTLLLGRFEASVDGSVPHEVRIQKKPKKMVEPGRQIPIQIGNSTRLSLLTWEGVTWSAELSSGRDATLEVTLAVAGDGGEEPAPAARLEAIDLPSGRNLLDVSFPAGESWVRHRVPFPEADAVRVRLSSRGSTKVAWAEVHLLGPAEAAPEALPPRPNIILVILDTLRADHLSTYGYGRPTSPNLDRLSKSAYVFERSLSASTWTLPSTASLLTGLTPRQHRLRTNRDRLRAEITTFVERLHDSGYLTVAFTDGGFLDTRWGFEQGFERYDVTPGPAWSPKDSAKPTSAAIEWIEGNDHLPYFLLLHTYETHMPYLNPEGFADPFFDGPPREVNHSVPQERMRIVEQDWRPKDSAQEQRLRDNIALYDGEIARADHYVGKVFAKLEERGEFSRTAVLLTSDHGEELMDHGNMEHGLGKVFDPNVRVPLLLKLPDQTEGARIRTPVTGLDVAPTLLTLAGLPVPPGLPGRSLLAILDGETEGQERKVFLEGLNSFPELNENRLRIDQGFITLVHDAVRGSTAWYDRGNDPEMRTPLRDLTDPEAVQAAAYLEAVLAWTSDGEMAVRLPAGVEWVAADASSRIEPRGAWSGLSWRPATAVGERLEIEVAPDRGAYLVFDLRDGGDWALSVRQAEEGTAQIRIKARSSDSGPLLWSLADESPPPPLAMFPTYVFYPPDEVELTPEAIQQLRALGYLQ